jgi:hypothetical protein
VNYRDADERSTLYLLSLEKNASMAQFLIRCGSDVEVRDLQGRSSLHVSAWQGHLEMVELLVSAGAEVNAVDTQAAQFPILYRFIAGQYQNNVEKVSSWQANDQHVLLESSSTSSLVCRSLAKAIKHLDRHQLIRTHQIHQFTWKFPTVPINQHPVDSSSRVLIHLGIKELEKVLARKNLKQAEKKVCDRETFAPSAPPLNFTTMSDRIEKGFQSVNRRFDTIDINLNTFYNNYITVRASIQAVIQERRSRNVTVSGIPETKANAAEREDPDPDIHCLKIKMKIPYAIDYDDAYRVGKWAPGNTRTLLIKFVRMIDKRRFINHRINLKGENIYVNDAESKEQRITRSILIKQFKAEKSLDKDLRSYIKKDILFISKAGVLVRKYAVGKDGLPSLSA